MGSYFPNNEWSISQLHILPANLHIIDIFLHIILFGVGLFARLTL